MDYAIIAAWGCNTIVILGVGSYIVFEILKRWRVGLRLSALDESLLHDEVVTVEVITDALGSLEQRNHSAVQLREVVHQCSHLRPSGIS